MVYKEIATFFVQAVVGSMPKNIAVVYQYVYVSIA